MRTSEYTTTRATAGRWTRRTTTASQEKAWQDEEEEVSWKEALKSRESSGAQVNGLQCELGLLGAWTAVSKE